MEMTEYFAYFQVLVGLVETYGGAYACKPGLIRVQLKRQGVAITDLAPDPQQLKNTEAVCREEYLSFMALHGADQFRLKKLKDDLSNDMTKGVDNFPKTLIEAVHLMTDYKVHATAPCGQGEGSEGVVFVQTGEAPMWQPQQQGRQPPQPSLAGTMAR